MFVSAWFAWLRLRQAAELSELILRPLSVHTHTPLPQFVLEITGAKLQLTTCVRPCCTSAVKAPGKVALGVALQYSIMPLLGLAVGWGRHT